MAVVETKGMPWQELRAAVDEAGNHLTPRGAVWEAKIAEGGLPLVRVLIRDRWWNLLFKIAAWSGGRRAAYEAVASGGGVAELLIYCAPMGGTKFSQRPDGGPAEQTEILCRIRAWLPRKQMVETQEPQAVCTDQAGRLDQSCSPLEETGISDLRDAIHANRVSFPSQVPTFLRDARPDLQRKLAQLYFVLGWSCGNIGARYHLASARVGRILSIWMRRAVKTGYIQQIPPTPEVPEPSHPGKYTSHNDPLLQPIWLASF